MAKNKSTKRRHTAPPKRGGTRAHDRGGPAGLAGRAGGVAETATHSSAWDFFEQASGTVRTALNVQDQWVRRWADFVEQSNRLVDSQRPWQKAMVATIPAAQRSIQASVEMMDRTSRSGIAWMKTALDSAAAPKAILAAGLGHKNWLSVRRT